MARMVRLEASGPIKIDPSTLPRDEAGNLKPIWVCACGLSQNLPYCDGSHKPCRGVEKEGELHVYDKQRKKVVETRTDA